MEELENIKKKGMKMDQDLQHEGSPEETGEVEKGPRLTRIDNDPIKILVMIRGIEFYKDKPEWRLSSEDHKKSLLFIEKIRGNEINMITLNLVEQEVSKIKNILGGEYGI
ncbi:MAG: hypothetical protein ACXQT5_01820 [Candidatus Syntropharchaeia archaeon]